MGMRILYFVQDLNDTAVARRVSMLHIGGAEVKLLGFYRNHVPPPKIEGITAISLGQTFDAHLGHRALKVARRMLDAGRWRELVNWANVLTARNLEMAMIADSARGWARSSVPLVYECLDIHRLSEASGVLPKLMRTVERHILRRSKALIVSSPEYIDNFFAQLGIPLPEIILAENKRVSIVDLKRPNSVFVPRQAPWKIGWFGNLRCTVSFSNMVKLARHCPKLVDFTLRGRPTEEIQEQIDRHLPMPNMRFEGRYDQTDLESLYQECDFVWAIERYPARGKTADWVLPNRLYEGGFYNVPVISLSGTACSNWLRMRSAEIYLGTTEDFERFFVNLTAERYRTMKESASAIPTSDFIWSVDDCREFTSRLVRTDFH